MPEASPEMVTLRFRMPDGSAKTWRFNKNANVQEMYSFVFANLSVPGKIKLSTNYPKKDLDELHITLSSAGIGDMESIMVTNL